MPRVFAAVSSSEGYFRALRSTEYPYVLWSFAYPNSGQQTQGYKADAVITDSGAFTAWQSGKQMDLGEYIAWCRERRREEGRRPDMVHVSLDVIPGERGRAPTEKERKDGMALSLANGDAMREAGLPIMEVYHQYEPVSFLEEILERMQPGDVLGISPRQGAGPSMHSRLRFCDGVFAYLLDRYGKKLPKAHGLGLTSKQAVFKYPWWSVDSLSWVNPGIWGRAQTRNGTEVRDPHIKGRPRYREAKCREVLETWKGWNRDLESMWKARGVTWRK